MDPKAVPLGLVVGWRIFRVTCSKFPQAIQSRNTAGGLMPLIAMSGALDLERNSFAVLVFTDTDRRCCRKPWRRIVAWVWLSMKLSMLLRTYLQSS